MIERRRALDDALKQELERCLAEIEIDVLIVVARLFQLFAHECDGLAGNAVRGRERGADRFDRQLELIPR